MLGSLKSMIWNDDPNEVKPAAPAAQAPQASSAGLASSTNPQMLAAIRTAVYERNTAYTQLKNAAESLADVIPDPTMRLKAAQKTAGAGRTAQQIVDAVDVHLQQVDAEELRFKTTLDKKINDTAHSLTAAVKLAEDSIASANAGIAAAEQQIANLRAVIAEQSSKASAATTELNSRTAELQQADAQFKAAADEVRIELRAAKSTILSTLS
jgi:chromosome segregation ATPase